MESPLRTSSGYSVTTSVGRINTILAGADTSYEEKDSIPGRDQLTFTNGFYVNCTAVWVDMRDSSALAQKYTRPKLAKLYRAYISELVAIMHLSEKCVEVNIQGDAVWGVFDTPYKPDIDSAFSTAVQCRSLVKLLNCRLAKYNYDPIRAGIGMHWGRALMIKAGYSGSGINDIVYMGDVVNVACALSDTGATTVYADPMVISSVFESNLNDDNKGLCKGPVYKAGHSCYTSSAVNSVMDDWVTENCV